MSFSDHCVQALARAGVSARDDEQRRIIGLSDFLCQMAQRDPAEFQEFLDLRAYAAPLTPALVREQVDTLRGQFAPDDANRQDVAAIQRAVRLLRYRLQRTIIWRQLSGRATHEETVAALSTMADELLAVSLAWSEGALTRVEGAPLCKTGAPLTKAGAPFNKAGAPLNKAGAPLNKEADAGQVQHLVVFGLGKLGGRELNLSSDIDLICAYPESGKTAITGKTNQQFFVAVVQLLLKVLGEPTGDGFGFRIDLRLRPYGDSGPVVQSFAAMERYFETSGRDWERYAFIKARACAGDIVQGAALLERLRPFVYRRYLDFAAIDAMREMRALIRRDHGSHSNNVKLGAGGIRDIEFLAQMLQMIWGGRVASLRTNSLASALAALVDAQLLGTADQALLWRAYVFFRNTEHCLQAFRDEQTHLLPEGEDDRERLAIAMGYDSYVLLEARLRSERTAVLACVAQWLDEDDEVDTDAGAESAAGDLAGAGASIWRGVSEPDAPQAGFTEFPEAVAGRSVQVLRELRAAAIRNPEGVVLARVDTLMPRLLDDLLQMSVAEDAVATSIESAAVNKEGAPVNKEGAPVNKLGAPLDEVLLRLEPLLKNVLRRSAYLVLLSENDGVRGELARLAVQGSYFTSLLAKHPALLEELFQRASLHALPEELYSQEKVSAQLQTELRAELAVLLPVQVADDLQQQHFDLLAQYKSQHQFRALLALARGDLTVMQLADYLTCLAESVIEVVLGWAWQTVQGDSDQPGELQGFVVLGYGKLGGFELGVGSDLDVVLVHDWDLSEHRVLHQLARRFLNYLAVQTYFGQLYEVDIRLRPSGRDGTMVSSLDGFATYQQDAAWLWEHQALIRARPVAGCARVAAAFQALRRQILGAPRSQSETRSKIVEMRERMRLSIPATTPEIELKQGGGGIVDIEFMVQYIVLGWAAEFPSLLDFPDNARILEQASDAGLLGQEIAQELIDDYASLRNVGQLLAIGSASEARVDIDWRRDRVARRWQALMVDGVSPGQLVAQSN